MLATQVDETTPVTIAPAPATIRVAAAVPRAVIPELSRPRGLQGARRLRRRDPEAEALLEVEVDVVGVVVVVADREVLPGLEQEVPAAQRHHDRAAHARRPDDRAAREDLLEVIEERVAAVLGG